MIGIDTNILVRLFVRDDQTQTDQVVKFFNARSPETPAFVGLIVLVETVWCLQHAYGYGRQSILQMMQALCSLAHTEIEEADGVFQIATNDESKADIADSLISLAALRHGCSQIVTFDRKAARDIPEMTLLT